MIPTSISIMIVVLAPLIVVLELTLRRKRTATLKRLTRLVDERETLVQGLQKALSPPSQSEDLSIVSPGIASETIEAIWYTGSGPEITAKEVYLRTKVHLKQASFGYGKAAFVLKEVIPWATVVDGSITKPAEQDDWSQENEPLSPPGTRRRNTVN